MFMNKFQNETYAVFRIVFGLLFAFHGTQKLLDFPAPGPELNAMLLAAGVIELVGGAMIAVGFMTSWAAFLASGTMAVAYWIAHGLNHLFPSVNKGEMAVLYCFAFLMISGRGSGIWSIDGGRG